MSRSTKICFHQVMPHLDRRSVLAGIGGLIALTPFVTAQAKDELRLVDLVGPGGYASDIARSMAGQTVKIRSYLAPSLDEIEFTLSESSPGACQLCGEIHDPGARITIRSAARESTPPIFEPILVEGQLMVTEPAAAVILTEAKAHSL